MTALNCPEISIHKQKHRMVTNAHNPMIPLSDNDRTENLLARDGRFIIVNVPMLLVESAFWGKFFHSNCSLSAVD
jgi:hypothetical protein